MAQVVWAQVGRLCKRIVAVSGVSGPGDWQDPACCVLNAEDRN